MSRQVIPAIIISAVSCGCTGNSYFGFSTGWKSMQVSVRVRIQSNERADLTPGSST